MVFKLALILAVLAVTYGTGVAYVIEKAYCKSPNGDADTIELKPNRGDESTEKTFKDLGCELKVYVAQFDEVEGATGILQVELSHDGGKSTEMDVTKEGFIDAQDLKLKVPALCGCLLMTIHLTYNGQTHSIKKKLEIVCPPLDGRNLKLKLGMKDSTLKVGKEVTGISVGVSLTGADLWRRIGHQSIILTAGIRCTTSNETKLKYIGNEARMKFGDIPLHETNLIDGEVLKSGPSERTLEGKLKLSECPLCPQALLVLAIDPSGIVNKMGEMNSGMSIGVNIDCGDSERKRDCQVYPAYEEEDRAWVVYPKAMPFTDMSKDSERMKKMVSGMKNSPPIELYSITQSKEISLLSMNNDDEAPQVVGNNASPLRKCAYMDPLFPTGMKHLKKFADKVSEKPSENPSQQLKFVTMMLDSAATVIEKFDKEFDPIARCIAKLKYLHRDKIEHIKMFLSKGASGSFDGEPSEDAHGAGDIKPNGGIQVAGDVQPSEDAHAAGDIKPNGDGQVTGDAQANSDTGADTQGSETPKSDMETLKDMGEQMLAARTRKKREAEENREDTGFDMEKMCPEIPEMLKSLVKLDHPEYARKLATAYNAVQEIQKIGFDIPGEFLMKLQQVAMGHVKDILSQQCQMSKFKVFLEEIKKVVEDMSTTGDNQVKTKESFTYLLKMFMDDKAFFQDVVEFASNVCTYIIGESKPLGTMCKEREDSTSCAKPWIKEKGIIYGGGYSPLTGKDCYTPVFMCQCGQCEATRKKKEHEEEKIMDKSDKDATRGVPAMG